MKRYQRGLYRGSTDPQEYHNGLPRQPEILTRILISKSVVTDGTTFPEVFQLVIENFGHMKPEQPKFFHFGGLGAEHEESFGALNPKP